MTALRRRYWVALFFVFISLGQAYPYSVAWSAISEGRCFCQENGRVCQHGCPLKRPQNSEASSHSQHHGHHHSPMKHDAPQVSRVSSGKVSTLVASSCAQKKQGDILQINSEPFLVSCFVSAKTYAREMYWSKIFPAYIIWFEDLEGPPPKAFV